MINRLSLSSHNQHLLFCCILSIFILPRLVLIVLFCAAIRKDSISLLKISFLRHVQIFSSVCRLKYPYSCLSSDFCFLVVVLSIFMLLVLFLVTVISLSWLIFMLSSSHRINALTLSSMQANPLPPSFLDTHSLSESSLGCKAPFIVICFLIFWSICRSSYLIHFNNGPEYFTRETAQVFISLMRLWGLYVIWLFQ